MTASHDAAKQAIINFYPILVPVQNKPYLVECTVCNVQTTPGSLDSHFTGLQHKANIRDSPQKQLGEHCAEGNGPNHFKCTICKTGSMSIGVLVSHISGQPHSNASERFARSMLAKPPRMNIQNHLPNYIEAEDTGFSCLICDTGVMGHAQINTHVQGYKHQKALQRLSEQAAAASRIDSTAARARAEEEARNRLAAAARARAEEEARNRLAAAARARAEEEARRRAERNRIEGLVTTLCNGNRPYLAPWPTDPCNLSCSLCSKNEIRLTYLEGKDHVTSPPHKEALSRHHEHQKRRAFHSKHSKRSYGGFGVKPDLTALKAFLNLLKRPLPQHELPDFFSRYCQNEFPTEGEARRAIMSLSQDAISMIASCTMRVFEKQKGNFLTQQLPHISFDFQHFLHLQLFVEEANALLELKTYNKCPVIITQAKNSSLYEAKVPGVAENRPSVLRGDKLIIHVDSDHYGANHGTTYYAYVHHVNVDSILFSLPHNFQISAYNRISMVFDLKRTQDRKLHRAVSCPQSALLFRMDTLYKRHSYSIANSAQCRTTLMLNGEQKAFINHINGPMRLSALWGPPGTGKTTTVVAAIIATALNSRSAKILVCTPSNEAADLIVERLANNSDMYSLLGQGNCIMRLNGLTRNSKTVPKAVLRHSPCDDYGNFKFPGKESIMNYRIVVSTLMTSDTLFAMDVPTDHFSHLFVDEAGHATEQLLMIALNVTSCENETNCKTKVVLAGDPKQLGPRVTMPVLNQQFNLYQSPLQRIQENSQMWGLVGSQLLDCYRSHPSIVRLINTTYNDTLRPTVANRNKFERFWDTQLIKGYRSHSQSLLSRYFGALRPSLHPILCLTHTHPDQREADSPSWMNHFELLTLVDIILELKRTKLANGDPIGFDDISVITPYRKQAQRISDKLYATLMTQYPAAMITVDQFGQPFNRPQIPVKVSTVDAFQGRESKVVIVSCVRSAIEHAKTDAKFGIGFLNQPERTNVALSRAKDLLIIIGNRNVLCKDLVWQEYFRRLDAMEAESPGVMINLGGPTLPTSVGTDNADDGMTERGGRTREE